MLKQFFYILICGFSLLSCEYLEQHTNKKELLKVDTIVDFKTVDAFPLFEECKDIPSREKQQICFQLEMSQHIYASLKAYSLNSRDSINDTVFVKLKVNSKGQTSLSGINISEKTKNQLPEFDSILTVSLQNLPELQPAIKRSIPVTTEFTLPIILKN